VSPQRAGEEKKVDPLQPDSEKESNEDPQEELSSWPQKDGGGRGSQQQREIPSSICGKGETDLKEEV